MRGDRGGYARALAHIRADEGLTRRKAKRRFLRHVWRMTSPGLRALQAAQLGLPYGPSVERSEKLMKRFERMRDARPLTRNERRMMRKLEQATVPSAAEAVHAVNELQRMDASGG